MTDELFSSTVEERWESKVVPRMKKNFRRQQLAAINGLLKRCTAGQEAKYYKLFPDNPKGERVWDAISILEHAIEMNRRERHGPTNVHQ